MKKKTHTTAAFAFSERVLKMRLERRRLKKLHLEKPRLRQQLSALDRQAILAVTGGRCHICGGDLTGGWEADHVRAHSTGGAHARDNFLAAHAVCNNYRWNYTPDEFQQILKLGVWVRNQIEKKTSLGLQTAEKFVKHETRRDGRRRPAADVQKKKAKQRTA